MARSPGGVNIAGGPRRAGRLPVADGGFLAPIGKNDEALAAYRLARSDQESGRGPRRSPEARRELGDTVNRIGRLLANTGRPRGGGGQYRTALTIRKTARRQRPADSEFRNAWRPAITTLAWCCGRRAG